MAASHRRAFIIGSVLLIFNFQFLIFNSLSQAQLVKSVNAVGMTVADIDRPVIFFTQVLGFEKISDTEVYGGEFETLQALFGARMRIARLKLGDEMIELTQYLAPEGRLIPAEWRSNDYSFQHIAIVVRDMDKAYQHLRSHKIRHASTGPQTLPADNKAAAGIRAFYFKDPDGHFLEIIFFPPDKGDSRWQQKTDRLFLGIDHTAIVVSSTENSLKFYREALGLRLAGESMNRGTEQAHLNNVAGARLRITGLRAQRGPGIEFLEYLAPRTGRPAPRDTQANDLWHWQTTLAKTDAAKAFRKLSRGPERVISSRIAEISEKSFEFVKGFLARDPDGHGLQVVER
jgi:catechol 2,3-dioxygenase-like lactoylglutathione lyase family enzyme